MCDDPHMRCLPPHAMPSRPAGQLVRSQQRLVSVNKDDNAGLHINVHLTAPLPAEFPDRQLITGISVLSEVHSLVVDVENPYTARCPQEISPCLANGGLRVVDGREVDDLLCFSREVPVAGDIIARSASSYPVECQRFREDKFWARMYEEMMQERRVLASHSFKDWILSFHSMAAPEWCGKYIAENDLADLQSSHAISKIDTPTVTVRLNFGVNYHGGKLDWDGRVLPDLDFWQMGLDLDGLDMLGY